MTAIIARYIPNGTPLTDYEREILVCAMEECGEIVRAASKVIRFGKENRPDSGIVNTEALSGEIGDLLAVVERLIAANLVFPDYISIAMDRKDNRLDKYLQTEPKK